VALGRAGVPALIGTGVECRPLRAGRLGLVGVEEVRGQEELGVGVTAMGAGLTAACGSRLAASTIVIA
jgi:diaminopimelate epimerase